jgi:ribosome biogenesis GTPase A
MAAKFIPRQAFPSYASIPRSYYLGHHRAGLKKMQNLLSSIDYVIECRDYRVPVTSINPMFEEALGKTRRLVVYTKRDLGAEPRSSAQQLVSPGTKFSS